MSLRILTGEYLFLSVSGSNLYMTKIHEIEDIARGLDFLQKHDPVFCRLPEYSGHIWPCFGPGFAGLVRVVLGQQISMKAADALWVRLNDAVYPLSAEEVIKTPVEVLKDAGLSRQKISYITGLADAMCSGDPVFSHEDDDETVITKITALKGFGTWSAQMYLIFAMGRGDVWPSGDLGIRKGAGLYLGLDYVPSSDEVEKIRERFSPYCSAASLLLWNMDG